MQSLTPAFHSSSGHERRAILLSLVTSIVLLAIKFVAYGLTGSAAIFSDAMEGIVNVLAAGFAMYALTVAARPADAEHPYGHGKIEFMSAGFEGGMILLAAIVMGAGAIITMVRGPRVERIDAGLALLVVAMLVNGIVGLYLIRLGKHNHSITLEADGHHLLADAVTSGGVSIALLLVRLTGWAWFDPIAALLVVVYVGFIAADLVRRAAAGLMDRQDVDDDGHLRRLLDAHVGVHGADPRICSYHKLRHRHSGRYHWVDFHLVVPADWNVDRGHRVASSIEYEIEQMLGEGNATAHIEPCPGCARCDAVVSRRPPVVSEDQAPLTTDD